jgi:hypothetical protein
MSEVHDAPETEDAPSEQDEGDALDQENQGGESQEDEEDDGAKKAQAADWEKRAHNHAGQAARERSKRQAAERKAADLEARLEKLEKSGGGMSEDQLLAVIGGLSDADDDPIGDIAKVKQALKLFRAQQLADSQESEAQAVVERQVESLKTAMLEFEGDFALDHADYHQAAQFYRKSRLEELQDAGYAGRNLERKLADDLFGVVRMSLEAGLDPAERVYGLAKKRGFKAKGGPAEARVDAVSRANETGVRVNGRQAGGQLSWGDVAKLDGAARDKAWAKLRERERRAH